MSWQTATLGELCDRFGGFVQTGPFGSQLKQSEYVEDPSGVPVVMPKDIKGGRIDFGGAARITDQKAQTLSRHFLSDGDIIFPRRGDINKLALVEGAETVFCGTGCLRIHTPSEGIVPKFLFYFLGQPKVAEWLEARAIGSTMLNLNTAIMRGVEIRFPDRPSQQRIASTLAAYDELIENNRRRMGLLEDSARQLYREWFVRLRFPGHEHVEISDGVPEGWERLSLSSICTRITDGSHASPQAVDEGFPMASVKDMEDWRLNVSSCRQISSDDYESLVRYDCKPLKGDVLIAKDGSYLKHCFVVQDDLELVILSSIAILRPNERIDPFLLAFTLKDPKVKEMMAGYVSGVALPRIILKEFRGFRVLVPKKHVQEAWAELIHPLCKQANILLKQTERLAKARDLLLPKLMSGAIPV